MSRAMLRSLGGSMLVLAAAAGAGCQANYAADVHNTTPQPVFVQMIKNANQPGSAKPMAVLQRRLGPGDRGALGPIRASDRAGAVSIVVDTLPNPSRPVTLDLMPGTTFLEVTMEGGATTGPIRVNEKR